MKKTAALLLTLLLTFALCACGETRTEEPSDAAPTTQATEPSTAAPEARTVGLFVLSGPTGIGAADLIKKAQDAQTSAEYDARVVAAPDEVVAKLSTGEADIAAVPTNLAAKLYAKTSGGVKILAVNTLGVLGVLNFKGDPISSVSDLAGRQIVTTGQGSNPEYIINYLLKANGLDPEADLSIEYKSEGSELVPVWGQDETAVIIAPQPVASSILAKYEGSELALDLTEEWRKVGNGSELMMGCVVARTAFIEESPELVEAFLTDYESSVAAVTDDVEGVAAACEELGIVPAAAIAKKAIPYCNICFITGAEMRSKLTGYLQVLAEADPSSVGGGVPDDGFWYGA